MTEELFRMDPYARECEALLVASGEHGVELDRTVFYPMGGGQPGDRGWLRFEDGFEVAVSDTRRSKEHDGILHLCETPVERERVGQTVHARIDWERRIRIMRVHTTLHLLCAVIPDVGVTGGSIRDDGTGRLDFNLPEPTLDRNHVEAEVNRLVREDHPVRARWISEEELDANPDLVRTMSVAPPRGAGRVRVLDIEGVDLQPCGGTHVSSTGEIGEVLVKKMEKKGRRNRRINIALAVPR
jgi:misacylated tRNA(Ala) deacylase